MQLEMSERTFRRYVVRYTNQGSEGLLDRRLGRLSPRRAGEEEVSDVVALYRDRYVRHFYEAYKESHGGGRLSRGSYSLKRCLQEAGVVSRGRRRGSRRELQGAAGAGKRR